MGEVSAYCPEGTAVLTPNSLCPKGYYCPNASIAIECPAGTHCPTGTNSTRPCYSDINGGSAEERCPVGTSVEPPFYNGTLWSIVCALRLRSKAPQYRRVRSRTRRLALLACVVSLV